MIRGLRAALLGALVVVALTGCETRVKESLEQKLQARADQGRKTVEGMLQERNATAKDTLPKDLASWGGEGQHPLITWRKDIAGLGYDAKLRDMEPKYPGRDLQKDLRTLATFLENQKKFWSQDFATMTPSDYSYALQEYYQFLKGYGAANPGGKFNDDIQLDEVLLHAKGLFDLRNVSAENQPTAMFRYWQFVFDIPTKDGEAFVFYVARLCDELNNPEYVAKMSGGDEGLAKELQGFCKDIPFEFRHIAIMAPYFELLSRKLARLKEVNPESPYIAVVDYLTGMFQEQKASLAKEFEEYPVLPDTMAATPAPLRLAIEIGPRGLRFADEWLQQDEAEGYTLSLAAAQQIRPDLIKKLNDVRAAGAPDLKSGEVFVLAAKGVPAGAVVALATAPVEAEENTLNQVVYLVGRRRFDGTNVRASVPVLLTKGAPEMNVGFPAGAVACAPFGYSGEPSAEVPAPTAALLISNDRVTGGAINPETGAIDALSLDLPVAEADAKKVSDWVGEQRDAVLIGVAAGAPWEQLHLATGPSAFRCKKPDCSDAELRATPKSILAICK
ncbi:MAG: hypothetical protein AMXMBFR64_09380 [Myxococcales bacterium]